MRSLFSNRLFLGWMLGVATVALAACVAGAVLMFGGYNVAADNPHFKPLGRAIHATMIHSVARRAANIPPPVFDMPNLVSGMREYEAHCMACHGGPGIDRARWASAMLPTPPFLVGSSRQWSRGELYTIIHGGVKMTGMPAWGEVIPKERIADVVTLLQAMPRLTPDQFAKLRARAGGESAAAPQKPVALAD